MEWTWGWPCPGDTVASVGWVPSRRQPHTALSPAPPVRGWPWGMSVQEGQPWAHGALHPARAMRAMRPGLEHPQLLFIFPFCSFLKVFCVQMRKGLGDRLTISPQGPQQLPPSSGPPVHVQVPLSMGAAPEGPRGRLAEHGGGLRRSRRDKCVSELLQKQQRSHRQQPAVLVGVLLCHVCQESTHGGSVTQLRAPAPCGFLSGRSSHTSPRGAQPSPPTLPMRQQHLRPQQRPLLHPHVGVGPTLLGQWWQGGSRMKQTPLSPRDPSRDTGCH